MSSAGPSPDDAAEDTSGEECFTDTPSESEPDDSGSESEESEESNDDSDDEDYTGEEPTMGQQRRATKRAEKSRWVAEKLAQPELPPGVTQVREIAPGLRNLLLKLQRLHKDTRAPKGERANAQRKLSATLMRHKLDEADIKGKQDDLEEGALWTCVFRPTVSPVRENRKRKWLHMPRWTRDLQSAIANIFCVNAVFQRYRDVLKYKMIGRSQTAELAAETMARCLNHAWDEALKQPKSGKISLRMTHLNYFDGYADGMYYKKLDLEELQAQAEKRRKEREVARAQRLADKAAAKEAALQAKMEAKLAAARQKTLEARERAAEAAAQQQAPARLPWAAPIASDDEADSGDDDGGGVESANSSGSEDLDLDLGDASDGEHDSSGESDADVWVEQPDGKPVPMSDLQVAVLEKSELEFSEKIQKAYFPKLKNARTMKRSRPQDLAAYRKGKKDAREVDLPRGKRAAKSKDAKPAKRLRLTAA